MPNKIPMVGLKFGRWTVIRKVSGTSKPYHYRCRCECGKEKLVDGNSLRAGHTHSCGCLRKERLSSLYLINLVGSTFGRWTVIRNLGYSRTCSSYRYQCRCECGTEKSVMATHLRSGKTRSCGCLLREGSKHGMWNTPEYLVWVNMRTRCNNPRDPGYKHYGGRGIKVCKKWNNSFLAFIQDVGKRPSPNLTIERINNNRGYEPGNVRWATREEQYRNRRGNVWVEFEGEKRILADWSKILHISAQTLGQWRKQKKDWTIAIQSRRVLG